MLRRSGFKQRSLPVQPERRQRDPHEFASVKIELPRARMAALLQAETPRPVEKDTPHYSAAWRAAVSDLRQCVRCDLRFPPDERSDPAHRNEGKGGSMKVDDCLTASLCRLCHREIDQGKNMSREERRREIDRAILKTLVLLFRAGKVQVVR